MLIQQTQQQQNVEYQVTCQCYLLHSAAVGFAELAYFPLVSSESQEETRLPNPTLLSSSHQHYSGPYLQSLGMLGPLAVL